MWRFLNGKWMLFAPENEGGAGSNDEPDDLGEDPDDEPQDEPEDDPEDAPEGDEPEGDSEGDEPPDEPAPQRRENRFQRQANELRTEREARVRAEERARLLEESRTAPRSDPNEAARVRAEKMALMEPQEKENFLLKERLDRMEHSQQAASIQTQEAMDRSGFRATTSADPVRAKYADRVDALHDEYLRKGTWVPRETAYTYLLGDDARKKLEAAHKNPKAKAKEREAARGRVDSAKGAPTSARSDGGSKRTGKGDDLGALTNRLIDVQL